MRVILDLPDPSEHWLALVRAIETDRDLPDHVALVVRKSGIFLREANGEETPMPSNGICHPENSIYSLKGKVACLQWINDRFPPAFLSPCE